MKLINSVISFLFFSSYSFAQTNTVTVNITGSFPDIKDARFTSYQLKIDTPLINGKVNLTIALDKNTCTKLYFSVNYPWPKDDSLLIYRDKTDGIVKSKRINYKMTVSFSKPVFINPKQSLQYHIEFEKPPTVSMLENFRAEDYKRTNLYRLKVSSSSKDSKVFEAYDSTKAYVEGLMFYKIQDSLYKKSLSTDKIYIDFYKEALKLNIERNYWRTTTKALQLIEKNLNSSIAPFLILEFYKKEILQNHDKLQYLLSKMKGAAAESEFYKSAKAKVTGSRYIVKEGEVFPLLNAKNLQFRDTVTNYSKANYSLVEFWASWCVPCRKQNPEWNKLLDKYPKKDFQIIGVSFDKSANDWKNAVEKDSTHKWLHISDLEDGFNSTIALQFGIDSIPFNVLVNNKGNIIKVNMSPNELSTFLKAAL